MKIAAQIFLVTICALAPQVGFAVENAPSPTPNATSAVTNEITVVPAGTMIVVTTRRSYKSYGASTGTKVTYSVLQDAIINGHIFAKAGDVGEGQVLNAREGSENFWTGQTEGANLRISLDKIYNFCGDTIEMDFARTEFRNREGFFGGKKDVEISKGQVYKAPTERTQKVCSEKSDATPAPIPTSALENDIN
jgi:hypothetical protein